MKDIKSYVNEWGNVCPEIKKILRPFYKKEVESWEADEYLNLATRNFRKKDFFFCFAHRRKFKMPKEGKKENRIVCVGRYGYKWMGTYFSFNSSCDRVGHFRDVKNIVSDALFEYHVISKRSISDLKFSIESTEGREGFLKPT